MIPSFATLKTFDGLPAGLARTFLAAWRCWLAELRQCLPIGVQRWAEARRPALGLLVDGETVVLYDLRGAVPQMLMAPNDPAELTALVRQPAIAALARRGVTLCLGEASCLKRSLVVPASAVASIERILALDVERLTPFKRDEIAFAWRADPERREDGRIAITQLTVRRAEVAKWLSDLKGQGLTVRAVAARSDRGDWREFDLLRQFDGPPSALTKGLSRMGQFLILLTVGCLLLAPAILVYKHGEAREMLDQDIERGRKAAVEAGKRFKEIESSTETIARLGRRKAASPILAAVIEEVTRILPDDAWLTSMGLENGELSLAGEARSAASLLGAIEASPLFEQARFTSPVSSNRADGSERFSITLKLVGGEPKS